MTTRGKQRLRKNLSETKYKYGHMFDMQSSPRVTPAIKRAEKRWRRRGLRRAARVACKEDVQERRRYGR